MPPVLIPWANERSQVWKEIESDASELADDGTALRGNLAPSSRTRWMTAIGVPLALLIVAATLTYIKSRRDERPAGNVFVEAEPLNPKAHRDASPTASAAGTATPAAQPGSDSLASSTNAPDVNTTP